MKKITLLIVSMLMVTLFTMAQIKFIVYKADGSTIELLATEVDSIGFEGNSIKPDTPDNPNIPNANGHEYVDLGLPSGTLWATMNVGATSAEDYGDYFCWGETTPKSSYTESNYTYSGKSNKLHLSSDAAYVNWGENWRMPTYRELLELEDAYYTTWTWTSLNGVNGYKVTSIVNGNSIFLPAAGYRDGSDLNYARAGGFYWSISKYEGDGDAIMSLNFNSRDISISSGADRSTGLSVRPVLRDVEPTYTLRFDANGGEGAISSIIVENGDWVTIPTSTFTRENYRFKGWSTEADGSGTYYDDEEGIVITSNLTLYAQWREGSGEGIPNVKIPGDDYTTLLFQIENATCDDFELYLMGIDGVWEDTPGMKFERVDGTQDWFQITIPALDETQSNFKIRANGNWIYEPKDGYELLDGTDEYVAAVADGGNINNLMMLQNAGGKVLALKVVRFVSPCAELQDYTITLKTNYCGEEGTDVAIIGGFPASNWDETEIIPMKKIDDTTYTYTIENCVPGIEFKFQSTEGHWINLPNEFNEEYSEWLWLDNFILGDETEIFIDLTDTTKYSWSYCIP